MHVEYVLSEIPMTIVTNTNQMIVSLNTIREKLSLDNELDFEDKSDNTFIHSLNNVMNMGAPESNNSISRRIESNKTLHFADLMRKELIIASLEASRAARPNIREFMDATGISNEDAHELIYGVIGSNGDYRDWESIMSNVNPIDAARAATAQLYNSDLRYEMLNDPTHGTSKFDDILRSKTLAVQSVLAKNGNFAVLDADEGPSLVAVSKSGLILRGVASSAEQISRTSWLFGFSTEGLGSLSDKVDSEILELALNSFA